MRVLLINPPFWRLIYEPKTFFPLPLGFIASVLEQKGIEVKIYNAENPNSSEPNYKNYRPMLRYVNSLKRYDNYLNEIKTFQHFVFDEIKDVLKSYDPDWVGVTAVSPKISVIKKVAEYAKKSKDSIKVVVGGPHPTTNPESYLESDYIDFVVRGEGEYIFPKLIEAVEGSIDLDSIKGISYKKGGNIFNNPLSERISDLDKVPNPAKHLSLFPERYTSETDMGHIVTARGCPFNCSFCGKEAMWGKKTIFKSVTYVLQEIYELIDRYGIRDFRFWDDPFTFNKNRTKEFCESLIKNNLNISWRCSTHIKYLGKDMLELMKESGCVEISVGIESGSDKILKSCGKGISVKDITNASKLLHDAGIHWAAYVMIGFLDETEDDIRKTMDLLHKIKPARMKFSILSPYPGTEDEMNFRNEGLLPNNPSWDIISHLSTLEHRTKHINEKRFSELVYQIADEIDRYNSSGYFWGELWSKKKYYLKNSNEFIKKIESKIKYIFDKQKG